MISAGNRNTRPRLKREGSTPEPLMKKLKRSLLSIFFLSVKYFQLLDTIKPSPGDKLYREEREEKKGWELKKFREEKI